MRELDEHKLERARSLIARGLTMSQVAQALNISRATLYNYGYRSGRGYMRSEQR